jgi:Zn-dependent protease
MRHFGHVTIGRAGLVPALSLAAVFALFGWRTGFVPIGMAALLGGIGGTGSLLIHELGHSFAARRLPGIRSAEVKFIWMGAATRFEGRYETGQEQAKVAIAGPQTSFILAITLGAACLFPVPFDIKGSMLLLCLFNIAIGVLNLLPTFPLDGHKVAVGLLWSATGSQKTARTVIRRIGAGWALLELPGALLLIITRPVLGIVVAMIAASFFAQKRLTRKLSV